MTRTVAAVGLAAEARIAGRMGLRAAIGGGDVGALRRQLEDALGLGLDRILSFGLCGALDPDLRAGDLIIGERIACDDRRFAADTEWTQSLRQALPRARLCVIAGVDLIVAGPSDKAALRGRLGADAVDMESHVAARFAQENRLPFAALRAVSDTARRALPPAAIVGLAANGGADAAAVIASLLREPQQIAGLIAVALGARAGLAALDRASGLLRVAEG